MVFIKLWSFKFEYIFEIEMFITVEQAKILKLVITLRKARAQTVKNPPAMQETQVRSLGRADPLQKGMATHSTVLAWRIPWTEEPGGLCSIGLQRVRHDWIDLACMPGVFKSKMAVAIVWKTVRACWILCSVRIPYSEFLPLTDSPWPPELQTLSARFPS